MGHGGAGARVRDAFDKELLCEQKPDDLGGLLRRSNSGGKVPESGVSL